MSEKLCPMKFSCNPQVADEGIIMNDDCVTEDIWELVRYKYLKKLIVLGIDRLKFRLTDKAIGYLELQNEKSNKA